MNPEASFGFNKKGSSIELEQLAMPSSRKEEEERVFTNMALRDGRVFCPVVFYRVTWKTFLNHPETFSLFTDKAYLGELWPIHGHSRLISLPGSGYAKYMVCLCQVLGSLF